MRIFIFSLTGIAAVSAALLATATRAQDYQGLQPIAQPDRGVMPGYPDAAKQDPLLLRGLELQRRREESVERDRLRLEQRQAEWQALGDRRAYRRLRGAYNGLIKDERIRDELARRNRLMLEAQTGQLPTLPGALAPRPPVPGGRIAAPPSYVPGPGLGPVPEPDSGPELLPAPGTPTPAPPPPASNRSLRPVIPPPSDDPIPAGALEL
jgi:hypothetical protein